MQVIRVHEFGGPEKLVAETAEKPEPKPGEVRVKVAAVGVNFVETYQRRGWYAIPLPAVLGGEFAGVVDALGEGVTGFEIGQQVATTAGMPPSMQSRMANRSMLTGHPPAAGPPAARASARSLRAGGRRWRRDRPGARAGSPAGWPPDSRSRR